VPTIREIGECRGFDVTSEHTLTGLSTVVHIAGAFGLGTDLTHFLVYHIRTAKEGVNCCVENVEL